MRTLITLAMAMATALCFAQPEMTGYEYWFDQNDGARVFMPTTPNDVLDEVHSPSVAGLAQGLHRINYRMRDALGQWSSVLHRSFTIHPEGPYQIVALRYWSDQVLNDPSDMVIVPVQNPAQLLDVLWNIDLCMHADPGITSMFYQLKDNHSQWSSVLTRSVDIDAVGVGAGTASITCADCLDGIDPNTDYTFVAEADGASNYVWDFPAGWVTVSENGNTVVATSPMSPNSGTVTVTPSNGCGTGADGNFLLSPTGIADSPQGAISHLFPNPTTGPFTITSDATGPVDVTLYASTGQQVGGIRHFAASESITVNPGDLAPGAYIVEVARGQHTARMPLLIQY